MEGQEAYTPREKEVAIDRIADQHSYKVCSVVVQKLLRCFGQILDFRTAARLVVVGEEKAGLESKAVWGKYSLGSLFHRTGLRNLMHRAC